MDEQIQNRLVEFINKNGLTIIKLGGAAITDKTKDFTLRKKVLDLVMSEIKSSGVSPIIVHGAGSFAHNIAKEYKLKLGRDTSLSLDQQLKGIVSIRLSLLKLHRFVLKAAIKSDLLPFSLPVSSTLITSGDLAFAYFIDSTGLSLVTGLIPTLYGDICLDLQSQFRVVSGDLIIKEICRYLNTLNIDKTKVQVIFGSNVDGIYDRNPNDQSAILLQNIEYNELEAIIDQAGGSGGVDVTGGMKGKLMEIKEMVDYGFSIKVVNITKENRLFNLLTHKKSIMTSILFKNS